MLWFAIVFLCLPTASAPGQSSASLTCPDDSEILLSFQPDYARQGGTFEAYVEPAETVDPARLTSIRLAIAGGQSTQLTAVGPSSHAVLQAPASGRSILLVFAWDQDVGTPAACHRSDTYRIPLAAPRDRIGDPRLSRLEGRFCVAS